MDDNGLLMLSHDIDRFARGLVILDAVFAYTRGDANTSKDSRRVLDRLQEVAPRYGCAVLVVRRIGKGKGGGDPRRGAWLY